MNDTTVEAQEVPVQPAMDAPVETEEQKAKRLACEAATATAVEVPAEA